MVRATRTLSSFDSKSAPVQDRTDARKVLAEAERSAGPKWGDILYVPELGDTQITLYAPVRRGNRFLGAIVSVVSIANLSRSLSESNSNSVAFILTEDDRVIAHPALAGGPRGASPEKPLLKLTEIGDPVLEHIWSMPERAAFPASSDASVLTHAIEVSGEEYTFLYRRVDDYGESAWIVGAYVKSSVALPLMERIRWAGPGDRRHPPRRGCAFGPAQPCDPAPGARTGCRSRGGQPVRLRCNSGAERSRIPRSRCRDACLQLDGSWSAPVRDLCSARRW
jgi:hypothetical protein